MNRDIENTNSNIQGLPELPPNWEWVPLKYLCEISAEYGLNISSDEYSNEGVRFIRTTDIKSNGDLSEDGVYVDRKSCEGLILDRGDILLTRSGSVGKAYRHTGEDDPCSFASYLVRFRSNEEMDSKYVKYYIESDVFEALMEVESTEATISNVSGKKFASLYTPKPDKQTQSIISRFLDLKTEDIDDTIERLRQLLELLNEKRQSLITSTVTHGLNKDDSLCGTDSMWVQEMPENWELTLLKYVTSRVVDGVHEKPDYVSEGIPFLTISDMDDEGTIDLDNARRITEKDYLKHLDRAPVEKGDILISKDGATIGKIRLVDFEDPASIFVSLALIKPNRDNISSKFLYYALRADNLQEQYTRAEAGSAIKHIHLVDLRQVELPLPPMDEQKKITDHLDKELSKISSMEEKVENLIVALQEKRQALITKAVTGQLYLSDWDVKDNQELPV